MVPAALELTANEPTVLVGHSGAGFFLPSITAGLNSTVRRLVFVDAGVPPCERDAATSAGFLEQLRSLAPDGTLPKWSTWWRESVMEHLVPDGARRAEIEAEMPEVPLAFFETPMPLPVGWCGGPGAFVVLSEPYRRDANTARSLGWPVVGHLGNSVKGPGWRWREGARRANRRQKRRPGPDSMCFYSYGSTSSTEETSRSNSALLPSITP